MVPITRMRAIQRGEGQVHFEQVEDHVKYQGDIQQAF